MVLPLPLRRPAPSLALQPAPAGFRSTLRRRGAGLLLLILLLCGLSLRAQTSFNYTGGTQTYTVPAGVTRLNVTAYGSAGNGSGTYSRGARVDATLTVVPGEVLTVVVGGIPSFNTSAGGYNGGGNGSSNNSGGGGSTSLNRSGTATGDYLASRNALLVAGGGGGTVVGTLTNVGGNGGTPTGTNGGGSSAGGGATQSAAGTGGGFSGGPGSNATGGNGASGGGGGGGGYYGGGGASKNGLSSTAGAGGGGSSWVMSTGTNVSYATSTGLYASMTITPTPPTVSSFTPATGPFGSTVTITGDFINGATGVLFNGVTASSFTVVNATTVTAVVPSSTTGPVSVVGLGGTGSSASSFTPVYIQPTARNPARHALAAATSTTVGVTFDQAPTAASAAGIRIFSSQYRGRRTATAAAGGNTATLTLSGGSFRPGEVVQVSVPATVQTSGGTRALAQMYQFTTAAGGTGRANFLGGGEVSATTASKIVAGDLNGDGDLDLVSTGFGIHSGNSLLSLRLNDGTGSFSGSTNLSVGNGPAGLALGDIDGDGDLDIVTANENATTCSIRLNDGSGGFATGSELVVGSGPGDVALGDLDGDGDLDLVASIYNNGNGSNTAAVRLNDGAGNFSGSHNPTVANNASGLALGDVDNDGDLDLLTFSFSGAVLVRLNNGAGTFGGGSSFSVGGSLFSVVLADVNADGDLDLIAGNYSAGTVSVRMNDGAGNFSGGSDLSVGSAALGLALADVDADGDLDIVTARGGPSNQVSISRNNGDGSFAAATNVAVGNGPVAVAVGDLDGDGDLDLATANRSGSTIGVRLNQPPAPTISAFYPNPAGAGIPVTLNGTNLGSATALTINGAAATILSNTASVISFRVPAGATATGISAVTTSGGTALGTSFEALLPPGNALAFDGADDYVTFGSTPAVHSLGPGSFTLEAWVYYNGGSGAQSIIRKDGDYNFYLSGNTLHAEVWPSGVGNAAWRRTDATTGIIPPNRWTHVAAVWSGGVMQLYVNGALQTSTTTTGTVGATANLTLGKSQVYGNLLNGRLDEVRIYNAALSLANIQADMLSPASAAPGNLKLYLSFDQGTPGGNNTGLTTLYDQASSYTGTLSSYTSLGTPNTTSNWVESYALVVPTATAATALSSTTFTANWTAPATGTVDNGYLLDVSTSSTFATVVSGSPFAVATGTTSRALSGLTAGTTYYYRVRADKSSVTGQGAYSNVMSATLCAAPVAAAQNVTVVLGSSGAATVAATAVSNGSTADCGAASAAQLSLSTSSFGCADATPAAPNAALGFNGSTQYVEGVNSQLPLGNAARTIEAWVYPVAASANGVVFNYGTPITNQRAGLLINNGNLYFVGENHDLRGNVALTVNAWNHVAATFDGAALKLYVNGVLDVQTTTSAFNTVGTTWRIAQRSAPQTGEFLTGRIDEVRVWNVARTAQQLAGARAASLPGSTSGLVACYRLNEGSGSTVADASAAGSPGTLYNAPTWLTPGAPVTPGVPVTLTVTDAGGASSTATALVTVQDNTAPAAAGRGALPAAPALAVSNVPEAGNYGVLYQLDMPTSTSFNGLASVPYAVNNSAVSMPNPARVAYFMELQAGGVTKWAWASMDNFAANLTQLGLPNPNSNNVVWRQNVSNLNVFSSTGAGVTTGSSLGTGRVEMWYWNYTTGNVDGVPGANNGSYDFGDEVNVGTGNYGSFQVHNLSAGQTVLAYNNWGSNGGNGDLGIGNQATGSPDWTFANNAGGFTIKRLYILVPNGSAFTQNATVALDATGTATLTQSQVYTGAADNCGVSKVTITPSTFSCANTGQNLVTVAVADASGNTTTQSAFVTVTVPPTATTTWSGAASTSWTDCANWSYGKVPDATTSVVIPAGLSRYPLLTSGLTAAAADFTLASGGSLTLNSGATLQLTGNYQQNAAATLSGTVALTGTGPQTIGGSTAPSFATLTVNKASGSAQLGSSISVGTALTMTSGTLSTDAHKVTLGSTATISESATSYVTGKVETTRLLSAAGTRYSFGSIGLALTPSGPTLPGSTLVSRVTGTALSGQGSSASIKRYYDIQPTVNAGLSVTVELGYAEAELNGIGETELAIFRSTSGLSGPWQPVAHASQSTAANTLTATGVTHFSVWTLGARSAPLPVELTAFTAERRGPDALLHWTTAQELHNAYFAVESSHDGRSFQEIGRVAGQGSSTARHDYQLTDAGLARYAAPVLYYRLRQVDLDGTATLSAVRTLSVNTSTKLLLYPNPIHDGPVQLRGAAAGAEVRVYDARGRLIAWAQATAAGTATLTLPKGLPAGVYVVRTGQQTQRLLVD